MYHQEKCACCHTAFTQNNLARIIPNCGHNICSNCHKNLVSVKANSLYCNQCKQQHDLDEDDLQSFPKNISIIKQLRESSLSASLTSQAVAEKKISSDQTDNSGSLLISASPLRSTMQKCSMHSKPLQIICKVDKQLLCANCALFGEHRNHDLRTLEEFEEQIERMKTTFKEVKTRKKNADSSVKGQQFRSKIIQQITKKKDELIIDIRNHFAQLMSLIKDAESKIYDELVQAFRNIDAQISKTTKQEHYLESVYDRWFKNAYTHMANIDNVSDVTGKINLVYDPSLNLSQGMQCVREIEQKNNNIKETIKSMIDSIRMQYSVSMEGYIYNYARVNFNPVQLTHSDHLIDMAPQTSDFNLEHKKKPIKAQFVKSDAIFTLNQPKQKIVSRDNIKSPIRQGITSPMRQGVVSPKMRPSMKQTNKDMSKKMQNQMRRGNNTPQKHYENLDFAERMLNQFRKSTQTLDLTGCDLIDSDILHVVSIASEEKPIKCMKVSKNKLTNVGLARLLQYMSNATNINVSHNSLTDDAVDQFINRRQSLPNLRIINLSHNKLNERKVKSKIEELKRMGIIATL